MCLYTRQIKPKVFTKDRVFYKVLYLSDGKYYTPFTENEVTIGEDICAEGPAVFIPKDATAGGRYNKVAAGYIHLLKKKYEAESLQEGIIRVVAPYEKRRVDDVVIVRAIVPAGTEYYSGTDGNDYDSVAVKKVKYKLI